MHKDRHLDAEGMVIEKDATVQIEEIVSLRRSVGWPVRGDYGQILEEGVFQISARFNGELVGFLQVVGSPHGDLLIHDVCVRREVQGRGVGTRMVEMAIEVCHKLGPQGINVLFEEDNRPFFEHFGFKIMYGGYMEAATTNDRPTRNNKD
jgi:GNAT superfamily N-acetyltransferase